MLQDVYEDFYVFLSVKSKLTDDPSEFIRYFSRGSLASF